MNILCWLLGHKANGLEITVRHETPDRWTTWETCARCGTEHRQGEYGGLLLRRMDQRMSYALPRGYGVAWYSLTSARAVIMPVPLNVAVAAAFRAWWWLKVPRVLIDDPHAAYQAGLEEGRRQASGK